MKFFPSHAYLAVLVAVTAFPAASQQPSFEQPKAAAQPRGFEQPLATRQPSDAIGQLDASPAIFTVLAAINAAGYDAEINAVSNHPLRKAIRDYLAKQNPRSLDALKRFVRDHRPRDPGAELSQYISYALATEGPPRFDYKYQSSVLPIDVAALEGLSPLLAEFYVDANIEELWKQSQPYFDQVIAQYHEPVARAVLEVNSYLRNPTSGYLGRHFQIFVDLLGAPNQVQSRSYVDDYYVVVTPAAAALPISEIRHGYLHYLVDPLTVKFGEDIAKKSPLGDYAQGAQALPDFYKSDFNLLATECFIKAVESRMDRKPAAAEQAMREGFVLTPAFVDQLQVYEKQDTVMRLYFPELVAGIDFKREEKRLAGVEFSARATRTVRAAQDIPPVELTGTAKTLDEAEQAYTERNLARAKETYSTVLQQPDQPPIHAKAYYGLARVAVLERDPETGDRLFRKALELQPDPSTKAWCLLYLARLADSQKDREQAIQHYQAVLAVEGAPESVRQAAEKGVKEAFTNK